MTMIADFLDSHERHLTDADFLHNNSLWANADHLYGIAAECGLKRIMQVFEMTLNPVTGSPQQRADWVHADGIWARFESYRSGHHHGAGYALPTPSPFGDWHVSQRYAHRSNFDQARADSHRIGANVVRALVHKARLEGLC